MWTERDWLGVQVAGTLPLHNSVGVKNLLVETLDNVAYPTR